jgi:nucleotide-binding universal stress UspA family protein
VAEALEKPMKILLAIDDSKFSEAAIESVVTQFRPYDAEIRVVHVVEPPSLLVAREMGGYDPALDAGWVEETNRAESLVARVAEALRAKGLRAATAVEQGDPKSEIIRMAREWPADLIVLVSHGHKGLDRFLMGSVSEAVARHAHCSVQIVRIPSSA